MLPPVTYSIQRLPQIALEKIPMCDVRGIDLDALPLQDSQLEVQQLGRYIQTSGHLEEVHLHLQRLHDLVITQHELRSEHICLILHTIRVIKHRKLMECADGRIAVKNSMSQLMSYDNPLNAFG